MENKGRGIANDLFIVVKGADENGVLLRTRDYFVETWHVYRDGDQWVLSTTDKFNRLVPGAKTIAPFDIELEIMSQGGGPFTLSATCGAADSVGASFVFALTAEDCGVIYQNLTHDVGLEAEKRDAALLNVKQRLIAASQSQ